MKKTFFVFGFISLFGFNSKAQNVVVKNNFSDSCKTELSESNNTRDSKYIGLSDIMCIVAGIRLSYFPENPDETIIDAEDYRHRAK